MDNEHSQLCGINCAYATCRLLGKDYISYERLKASIPAVETNGSSLTQLSACLESQGLYTFVTCASDADVLNRPGAVFITLDEMNSHFYIRTRDSGSNLIKLDLPSHYKRIEGCNVSKKKLPSLICTTSQLPIHERILDLRYNWGIAALILCTTFIIMALTRIRKSETVHEN